MKTDSGYNSIINLQNLRIGYRRHGRTNSVFGPFSTIIQPREMISLIGRNGVGKSTLLRTLAGLQGALAGKIFYNGSPVESISLKEKARMVSFVSTESVYSFHLRVREIITLGRFPYTGWLGKLTDDDRAAIDQAIYNTGIAAHLNKPVHEISDGERQKVMIARALAQDTPLIILDEPTAYLDLPSRYEILRLLSDLTKKGKTILFSTHDLNIAMDIADKIWLMSESDLHEGSPEDLLINDVFRKLFNSSPARFDTASMQFRFSRELTGSVRITGNRQYQMLTERAMHRIGYSVSENAAINIEIEDDHGIPCWKVTSMDSYVSFDSIYELTKFLKNKDS